MPPVDPGGVTLLVTVTVTVAVVLLPAASRATAARVCAPLLALVVSQVVLKGEAVSSAPRFTPSSWNCTPATPTLSLALAETVIEPETVAALAGAEMETEGGVVSGLETVTVTEELAVLPAASRAVAVRVCAPGVAVVVFQLTL